MSFDTKQVDWIREEMARQLKTRANESTKVGLSLIYLSFAFLFALIVFLGWMLWDFGIAGRVIIFFVGILVLIQAALKLLSLLFDKLPWS
jgi:energy-converting hydrogenase Eha subunit E